MSFTLQLYLADESSVKSALPTQEEYIVGWLDENAKVLGNIEFEPGECFAFFKAIYLIAGVDLLLLIGGSVHEDPAEEEYCCGSLTKGGLGEAIQNLQRKLPQEQFNSELEADKQCQDYLQTQGLSDEWFLQVATELLKMLESAENCVVLGLFE